MDKNNLIKAIQELKKSSQKRNFRQSVDFIVTFRNFDPKKTPLDFYLDLHYPRGKNVSVCAFVGPELKEEAKNCDEMIMADDFPKYTKDKKLIKALARKHNFFIAQANLMGKVATTFGRILGTRGKMPNPKAGCVVPPKASLKPLHTRLQKLLKIKAKAAFIQCPMGSEEMPEEQVADNILTLYNALVHHLPLERYNIRTMKLKLTMGKPVKIDDKGNMIAEEQPKEEIKEEKPFKKKEEKPKAEEKPKEEAKK